MIKVNADQLKFLIKVYRVVQDAGGEPLNAHQIASGLGVTPIRVIKDGLDPIVAAGGAVILGNGRYLFKGRVKLQVRETREAHWLDTWDWLLKERGQK